MTERDGWVFADNHDAYAAVKVVKGGTYWNEPARHRLYHNRFLQVPNALKQTKMPGEAFRIVLTKSGDQILWTELK